MDKNRMPRVLMIGAARDVQGGVSTVVNTFYDVGLDRLCELKYIGTMKDGSKFKKLTVAGISYLKFCMELKNYDIVHVHLSSRNSTWRKAHFIKKAHQCGKKIVIHLHGSEFDIFYRDECSETQKEKIRSLFQMADVVIALSEEWKDFLKENVCDERKIRVIYNSIKVPEYRKEDYSKRNVLFLGRIGERKGAYDFLKIAPSVLKKYPDAHFYFGGDGDVEEFKQICAREKIEQHISYIGWVKNEEKIGYFKKCSVYFLPSHAEGMPMSVLEAMSYGLVPVSTFVGGIPKLITDGTDGILFQPGDLDGLYNALDEVLGSEEKRRRLGRHSAETIRMKFNAALYVKKLVELYQTL